MKKRCVLLLCAVIACAALTGCGGKQEEQRPDRLPSENPRQVIQAEFNSIAEQPLLNMTAGQFQELFNSISKEDRQIELENAGGTIFNFIRDNRQFYSIQCDNDKKYIGVIYLSCPLENMDDAMFEEWKTDVLAAMNVVDPSLSPEQREDILGEIGFARNPDDWPADNSRQHQANQIHYYIQRDSKLNNLQFYIRTTNA